MKQLKKLIEFVEKLGWEASICQLDGDNMGVEFEQYSPAGEDFMFCIYANDIKQAVEELVKLAENFDEEEHVKMWVEAKARGVAGIPSIKTLVQDAEEMHGRLEDLAEQTKNKFLK